MENRNINKDNIWGIWKETSKFRQRNISNYIIALSFAVISIIVALFSNSITRGNIRELLSLLLGVNGAILGLVIAGYSFANAIPKQLMSFMASTKAEDYPWSNFKQILLNYLYCYVALFSGIILFCFLYLCTFCEFRFISKELITTSKNILFIITWTIQGFILSELKIFLFWIYDNSLTLGQVITMDENKKPFDEGNA